MSKFTFFLACVVIVQFVQSQQFSESQQISEEEAVTALNLDELQGTWHEVFASSRVHSTLEKNCNCVTSTFTFLGNNQLNVNNECLNAISGQKNFVNYTLTQLKNEQPGLFHMFINNSNIEQIKQRIQPKDQHVNFIVLKYDANKAMMIYGPKSKFMWILSRDLPLNSQLQKQYINYAKQKGIHDLVQSPCQSATTKPLVD